MYDDDRDALAAEYVLGTLSADERDQAEALLLIDPGFADIVRGWERRLGELNVMVEAVEPPPEIWERIKTDIDGAERRIAEETAQAAAKEETPAIPEEDTLPTIGEAAPQTVPEAVEGTAEAMETPQLPEPAEIPPAEKPEPAAFEMPPVPAEESDVAPEDADDSASVAALASSLLSAEPASEAAKAPPSEPAVAPGAAKIERSADVIYLADRMQRWRGLAVAMSAVAALLAVYVGVSQFAPSLLPAGGHSQAPVVAAAPQSQLVAVLQQEPTAPAFLVTVDPQNRTMTARRLTTSPDAGRSYELWLIAGNDQKPVSLGVVGGNEFTTRPLPAGFDIAAIRAASYAISLEPAGGSPSGAPTGPILFKGKMVEAVSKS